LEIGEPGMMISSEAISSPTTSAMIRRLRRAAVI
jgi:hypothetical protein